MHAAVVFCFFGSSLVYFNLLLVRGLFGALKELYVSVFICHATLKPMIILPQPLIAGITDMYHCHSLSSYPKILALKNSLYEFLKYLSTEMTNHYSISSEVLFLSVLLKSNIVCSSVVSFG